MSAALRRLVELAQAEHRLAAEGPAEDLAAVQDDLSAAVAALPPGLTPEEREQLLAAFTLRERTMDLLRASRDECAAELQKLGQGRTTVQAYVPAGAGPGRSIDHSA